MTETLIKKIDLESGLTLEFINLSRKIAGDRYLVALMTRIKVPVEKRWFSEKDLSLPDIAEIRKKVGKAVFFEHKKERNFIDEGQKEEVLNELIQVAEEYGVRYLGHPDFPKKLILKRFNDKAELSSANASA
jgi:hypothetical protein